MTTFRIARVRLGTPLPHGPQGQPSAIVKLPVNGPVVASQTGLAGDEQGDKKNHGGRDKAIHADPVSHHPTWASKHPSLPAVFPTGTFGENLVVEGVTKADVCLGDR